MIKSFDTGKTRELDVAMGYFGPIRWSPDGRSFLLKGSDLKGRAGIHQIDAQTGEISRLSFAPGPCAGAPEWSPDGTKIYFWGGKDCPSREGTFLLEGDLTTGEQREILRGPSPRTITLSPDGRFLAGINGEPSLRTQSVVVGRLGGAEFTELHRLPEGQSIVSGGLSWAPDGRTLLVTIQEKTGREILLVPIAGGPPRKLEAPGLVPSYGAARVDRSSKQIALPTGENKSEVWVLENFLPALSAAK